MELTFAGKNVFLTGASRGIGRQIMRTLEDAGANVLAPGRDALDLTSRSSIGAYTAAHPAYEADVFIHCAGVNELAGIDELNDDLLDRVFQVNCFSAAELMGWLCPAMKRKGEGRIVLISSLYALVSRERRVAYTASKSALSGLMRSTALELAPYGVLVNCVAPGYVLTQMSRNNLSDGEIAAIAAQIPTGRFQTEEDVASLVAFLCSGWNRSITGQLIAVDGGFTCR